MGNLLVVAVCCSPSWCFIFFFPLWYGVVRFDRCKEWLRKAESHLSRLGERLHLSSEVPHSFRGLENKASRALGSGQNGHAGRTRAGHEWDDGEPQVAREVPEPLSWRPDFRQDALCLSCREWALHVLALLHEHIIHK